MALSASIIFEFRSTATANMVNGGGFKAGASGTDYSQQDAAQWNASDGTSNASTTFTSASSTFTSAIVGNVLHLVSGTNGTVGWYEVTGYTDANTITLDRNCSTGAMSNGVFYIGGSLNVGGSLEDDFFEEISGANANDGIVVYFYNNNTTSTVTFTPSEAISISGAGGATAPIKLIGYKTTRGDNPTGTSRPTIATGANGFVGGSLFGYENLIFSGTGSQTINIATSSKIINCKATNTSTTASRNGITIGNNSLIDNCEIVSYRGTGISTTTVNSCFIKHSYIHDCVTGNAGAVGNQFVFGNIFENCTTAAVSNSNANTSNAIIEGNTLYGCENTLGTGISLAAGCSNTWIKNNIITGFATGASHGTAGQTSVFDNYNDYYNNDSDVSNITKGGNDIAVAPAFTSVSQITGTAGAFVAGGNKLVDTSKNFSSLGVVAGDCVNITGGTGATTGLYLVNSISTTTNPNDTLDITIPASPGTNVTADKTYQITIGHNFLPTGSI